MYRFFRFLMVFKKYGVNLQSKYSQTMRLLLPLLLFTTYQVQSQVFMQSVDNTAALSLGGAVIAYPGIAVGLSNEGAVGLPGRFGVLTSSALPFGIPGWQTAQFQGFIKAGQFNGFGIDLNHSGIETYNEQQFRLLYGRKLSSKIFLGGGLSLLRVNAQEYGSLNNATFSISILTNPLPNLWVGAKVHNPIQQKVADNLLPSVLRIGAAWKPTELFILLAEVEKDLERAYQIKAGVEYKPVRLLTIRAGMRAGAVGRVAFGAGFALTKGLSIDMGSEWHPTLGFTPTAMLRWMGEWEKVNN